MTSETGFDRRLYDRFPTREPRPAGELEALKDAWCRPRGWQWVWAINNNFVGVYYLGAAMLFFVLAGSLALLMRTQLALPLNGFLPQETYNQLFTMHGTMMMFLFAVPAVEALGVLLLPQMLGARDLPFPPAVGLRVLVLSDWRPGLLLFAVLRPGPPTAAGSCIRR
ncbi:cbb3-type cytochrome c oxidase subunit I [Phenylobacterium sp. J426]|uniref:cbb3-type cytochrome c oxidase subunit I n=1 Tax=Phenylobacterium sp. J426 TaxID=2898439 RepID=UPI0021508E94|nr:cbb3-type cytochrome c oxidase subunit I [Phenylobacterium sp. J426]